MLVFLEINYEDVTGGEDPTRYGLMAALFGLPYPDKFIGMSPKLHDIHYCKDGKFVGVSDLIGYRIEDKMGS